MHFQCRCQRLARYSAQAAVSLLMPLLPVVLAELGAPACVVRTFTLRTAAVPVKSLMDNAPKPQLLRECEVEPKPLVYVASDRLYLT